MKAAELRPSSLKSVSLYLTGAKYFPTLHRKPLDGITRGDVAVHLDRIASESGAPSASRARAPRFRRGAFRPWWNVQLARQAST
jgi:hypothetical protein